MFRRVHDSDTTTLIDSVRNARPPLKERPPLGVDLDFPEGRMKGVPKPVTTLSVTDKDLVPDLVILPDLHIIRVCPRQASLDQVVYAPKLIRGQALGNDVFIIHHYRRRCRQTGNTPGGSYQQRYG